IFGGNLAVSLAVKTQALTCAGKGAAGQALAPVAGRPELQSAAIQSTNGTDGTFVQYCFDQNVVNNGLPLTLHVYRGSGLTLAKEQYTANTVNADANPKCVDARYNAANTGLGGQGALTSAAAVAQLTLATV